MYGPASFAPIRMTLGVRDRAESAFESNDHTSAQMRSSRHGINMPILNDIMDNEVVGPLLRQGRAEGRLEGRVEGQVEMLLGRAGKRFGRVPADIAQRIAALKPAQLKRMALRLLDANRIEDLFAQ